MRVDMWSDLVCPWCYIGKRRFDRALAAFTDRTWSPASAPARTPGSDSAGHAVSIIHRAFQLDATMPQGQLFRHRDVLMRKYRMSEAQVAAAQTRLEKLAADEGLEYHLAEVKTGNTLDAHRLVQFAGEQGNQDAVIERFFRAHFTEGRSLFDNASLVALAEEAGLEGARDLLTSNRYAEQVIADHQEANALGANGVPFFVLDKRYGISGAQPTDVFVDALRRASDDAATPRS